MADGIEIELYTASRLKNEWPIWNFYPEYNFAYKKGKNPQILHIDITVDTSTADTATESTAPSNTMLSSTFGSGEQAYLQSDNATDTSKTVYIIGQKSDGTFGQFTFDTDGTTSVDLGTWDFMLYAWTTDTLAGVTTIDDDGAGTTVYFTLTSGSTKQGEGILVVPTGYYGTLIAGQASLTAVPGASTNGNGLEIGDAWIDILTDQNPRSELTNYKYVTSEETRVNLKHFYKNAVTTMKIEMYYMIWED